MAKLIFGSVAERRPRPTRLIVLIAVLGVVVITAVTILAVIVFRLEAMPAYQAEDLLGRGSQAGSVAFSPDGKIVATGGGIEPSANRSEARVWLWDVASRKSLATVTFPRSSSYVHSVAFSPDGNILAAGASTGDKGKATVWLWDVAGHRKIASLPIPYSVVGGLAFSHDGQTLAAAGGPNTDERADKGEVWLWDAASYRRIATFPVPYSWIGELAFSPDSKTLAVGGGDADANGNDAGGGVWLWDMASRRNVATLRTHVGVSFMAFSPDSKTLASEGNRNTGEWTDVWLWNLPSRRKIAAHTGRTSDHYSPRDQGWLFSSVAFSPDGKTLAIGGTDPQEEGVVLLWDVASRRSFATVTFPRSSSYVGSVAFSPDGKTLALGGRGLGLWRVHGR